MSWEPDPVAFEIFGFTVRYAGVFLVLSYALGLSLLARRMMPRGVAFDRVIEFVPYALIGGLGGGRVGYFLFGIPRHFFSAPMDYLFTPGFSIFGVVLGLLVAAWLYSRAMKEPFLLLWDDLAVPMVGAATLMALGSLFESERVGALCTGPLAMRFPRYDEGMLEAPLRCPTPFLWVGFASLVWFAATALERYFERIHAPSGALAGATLAGYFLGTPWLIGYSESRAREPDSVLLLGIVVSTLLVAAGVFLIVFVFRRQERAFNVRG